MIEYCLFILGFRDDVFILATSGMPVTIVNTDRAVPINGT